MRGVKVMYRSYIGRPLGERSPIHVFRNTRSGGSIRAGRAGKASPFGPEHTDFLGAYVREGTCNAYDQACRAGRQGIHFGSEIWHGGSDGGKFP